MRSEHLSGMGANRRTLIARARLEVVGGDSLIADRAAGDPLPVATDRDPYDFAVGGDCDTAFAAREVMGGQGNNRRLAGRRDIELTGGHGGLLRVGTLSARRWRRA